MSKVTIPLVITACEGAINGFLFRWCSDKLRTSKRIWHEHSFLSVKRLLLKNSNLKIWENSDETKRSYGRLNLTIFRSKFGPFCCSAKTWSRDKKRSSWRHLVGSLTASVGKQNKYKGRYRVAGYKLKTK